MIFYTYLNELLTIALCTIAHASRGKNLPRMVYDILEQWFRCNDLLYLRVALSKWTFDERPQQHDCQYYIQSIRTSHCWRLHITTACLINALNVTRITVKTLPSVYDCICMKLRINYFCCAVRFDCTMGNFLVQCLTNTAKKTHC